MAWKKMRTYKRPPYRRWGKNPQQVNTSQPRMLQNAAKEQHGPSVLYRDHVKSLGSIRGDASFEDDITTRYLHLPLSLGAVAIDRLKYPEDEVEFLKGKWISRGGKYINEWTWVTVRGGKLNPLHMGISGTKAFFIEEDHTLGYIRKSMLYNTERARTIIKQERLIARIEWAKILYLSPVVVEG